MKRLPNELATFAPAFALLIVWLALGLKQLPAAESLSTKLPNSICVVFVVCVCVCVLCCRDERSDLFVCFAINSKKMIDAQERLKKLAQIDAIVL